MAHKAEIQQAVVLPQAAVQEEVAALRLETRLEPAAIRQQQVHRREVAAATLLGQVATLGQVEEAARFPLGALEEQTEVMAVMALRLQYLGLP